jgi:hypothetical protein
VPTVARLRHQVKNYFYSFRASSTSAIIANGLNIVAKLYQWTFAVLLGLKFEFAGITSYLVSFFLASVGYSAVHGVVMPITSPLSNRFSAHEKRTAKYLAFSIDKLRDSASIKLSVADQNTYLTGILTAIRNEIEVGVVESAGIYINVSLLIEDPSDATRLLVIARALLDRPNRSYPKNDLFAWSECWKTKKVHYVPKFSDPEKPYKSILLIPVKIEAANGNTQVVGVISIDSSKVHHFDGMDDEIENKLLPELSLLKLVLN